MYEDLMTHTFLIHGIPAGSNNEMFSTSRFEFPSAE